MSATTDTQGSHKAHRWPSRAAARTPTIAPSRRRAGYVIAAAINVVLLWVTHHLLDWGWPSFLTPDFDEVLPIISLTFVVGIAFDLVLIVHDPRWLRTLDDTVGAVIGFVASWRTLTVFPFDFSDWGTDWSWLLRTILVVAVIGTAIAAIVGTVRLIMLVPPDRRP
jgi:hypothetical protein